MKKGKSKKITAFLMAIGILLIVLSCGVMILSRIAQQKAEENSKNIVSQLLAVMPDIVNGAPDDRVNMSMPMQSIEKNDFIGLIELPSYNAKLPICGEWDAAKITDFPCRYMGSMYDNTLIIGGSDNKGQFDFITTVSNDDIITVTDVTGLRFSYVVTDIRKTRDVSTENLTSKDADLVIFARNTFSFDYTVVRSKLKGN